MYGKLFAQMYDGTLATKGPWQALVTFQQLVILADKHGVVDMTAKVIATRTTIPLEIIQKGLKALSQPDPQSRTPAEEGRRIVRLSENRDWGWRIVNYEHFRKIRSEEDRREYHRRYYREKRSPSSQQKIQQSSTAQPDSTDSTKAVSSKHVNPNPLGHDVALIEFATAWKTLPKRSGNNPKADALRAWKARISEGVKPAAMIEGAQRYHAWCEQAGKINTEMVMRGSTFFGRARPFEQDFTLPAATMNGRPWFLSASAIDEKGRAQGKIPPQDKIAWLAFRDEVFAANGVTIEMVQAARKDFPSP